MQGGPERVVLRLSHRPGRDERMTTHVALTARAFGADRVVLPTEAGEAICTATDVTDRFGGPFEVEPAEQPRAILRDWSGAVAHLTMYGEPVDEVLPSIRSATAGSPLLIAVGAGKVPPEVYERATWNVAIGNQPHSEIAALAVFLDRYFKGAAFEREWTDADRTIVPTGAGKRVEDA